MSEPQGHSIVKERPKSRIDEQIERSRLKRLAKRAARKSGGNIVPDLETPAPPGLPPGFVQNQKGVTPEHLKPHLLQPGHGNKHNARGKLNSAFMSALVADFEVNGKRAIERMRIHDPSGYIKTVAFLMPKQFEQTTPMQDLTDEELARGIEYLRTKLALSDGNGARAAPLLITSDGIQTIPETN